MQRIFTYINQVNLWESAESVSGRGSELDCTAAIRAELPSLLQEFEVKSILDAPCGDFNWMRHLLLSEIRYTGVDVVSDMIGQNQRNYGTDTIRFKRADITKDELPNADLIICRDCLVHLSFWDISQALQQFKRSNAKYLLMTTYPATVVNRNTPTGSWRSLNLQLSPFNFPPPLKLLADPSDDTQVNPDKSLGLWKLDGIVPFRVARWNSPTVMLTTLVRKYINPAWNL
jgi:SAM-dependent methyltransferase